MTATFFQWWGQNVEKALFGKRSAFLKEMEVGNQ